MLTTCANISLPWSRTVSQIIGSVDDITKIDNSNKFLTVFIFIVCLFLFSPLHLIYISVNKTVTLIKGYHFNRRLFLDAIYKQWTKYLFTTSPYSLSQGFKLKFKQNNCENV